LTKYSPSRDIPEAVRQKKSIEANDIIDWVLKRRNEKISAASIYMWFGRHPTIKEDLIREIREEDKEEVVVKETVFKSGTFETYESIVNWIMEMKERDVVKWNSNVQKLKNVCLGVRPQMNKVKQYVWRKTDNVEDKGIDLRWHGWVMKHPDRLDLEDVREYVRIMKEHYPRVDTSGERAVTRDFLLSKGIAVGKKISGTKHKSAGTLSQLFVVKEVILNMLAWIKTQSFEGYVATSFMWETATRISATLNLQIQNISQEGGYITAITYDKGRRKTHPLGKRGEKNISQELYNEIKLICEYPKRLTGQVFTVEYAEMVELNKEAVMKFCPEVVTFRGDDFPPYDDWNHFWRHMHFQHMLRETGWNYAVVAALADCTVKSLEESYGVPPRALIRKWGLEQLPRLMRRA